MERAIKITADSTADLSEDLLEKYGIALVPLYINVGDKTLRDGIEITPPEIISYFEASGTLAKTSAIPVGDYSAIFAEHKDDTIIHINIGSGFSACHQNALLAAKDKEKVHVVDSENLSSGQGHLVVLAGQLAKEGHTAEEIVSILEDTKPRVEASFLIDTLTYLYKGGRCSALSALGANLLKIKPCIEVKNGKMGVGKKYRGNLLKCYGQYVDDKLAHLEEIDPKRIFITYCSCDPEIVSLVRSKVEALNYFEEILETSAGCTVSSHCGPNTLGVLFIRKP